MSLQTNAKRVCLPQYSGEFRTTLWCTKKRSMYEHWNNQGTKEVIHRHEYQTADLDWLYLWITSVSHFHFRDLTIRLHLDLEPRQTWLTVDKSWYIMVSLEWFIRWLIRISHKSYGQRTILHLEGVHNLQTMCMYCKLMGSYIWWFSLMIFYFYFFF